ncbi:MAG: relaxase domain-containing protein [Propionibacteriaceae bacterium]|nr:relaxase domain-containing protein [Propionibacteriaceae bacterium]
MTVSMRVMTAGDGYKYLLESVAAGDGDRSLSTPLTRYYTEAGSPPGRWMGAGIRSLRVDSVQAGDVVSEVQLQLLVGQGCNPVTGEPLGRPYLRHRSVQQRVAQRAAVLDSGLQDEERATAVQQITSEETARGTRRTVAGYDYTFSVPKSVSVLWGVADAGTQELVVQAHHDAVAEVVGFMEREVVATRIGASARGGPAVQADVTGVLATAFDHWDSRAGDPQLHTHVVVANKVCTTADGRWRAVDGRPMHAATVALSELFNAVLADRLTRLLGVGWDTRDRGRDRNPAWEIAGVGDELIRVFSTRSADIEAEADRLIASYTAGHGHRPSKRTVTRLRQQATLATRPAKHLHSLAELTSRWRDQATALLGEDATGWAQRMAATGDRVVIRADDVPLDVIDALGRAVVAVNAEKRSTWTRWNLHAEASRQTMGWRFASLRDRETVTGMIVDAAETVSLRLTPDALTVPAEFQRTDETSRFRPRHSALYTSEDLFTAEARLLALSRDASGPVVAYDKVEAVTARPDDNGRWLSDDQAAALAAIATSGRVVDVLVGPAGAGKTTALAALRAAWEHTHGPGTVVGLAPSATAAAVLADDLGITTENTAKWLTNHRLHGDTFTTGELVIVDEASLAGTFTLDQITRLAAQVGAKVLLVGDWAQLQAVDAGGAFNLLVADRDDAPELTDIHRFRHDWEKTASLGLRHGRPDAITAYDAHGRIIGGDLDDMTEGAYHAWRADTTDGRASLLIADSHDTVRELNQRARNERIITGHVDHDHTITLNDGSRASRGDWVITRHNDRRLHAGRTGWVRNGDRWTITRVHDDGAVTIRRAGMRTGGTVTLPADYAAHHLDLGYAVTAHRAQGVTVDTSHCVVTPTTTRENLYVAMTRGRETNTAYVATDRPDDTHGVPHPSDGEERTPRDVLTGVIHNVGAELSAHQTIQTEAETWESITQLGAEYETLAAAALEDRWATLIRATLPETQAEQVLGSEAFGPLAAELHRALAAGWNPETEFPRLVAARPVSDAADVAAVLHGRLARVLDDVEARPHRRQPAYILGMYPEVTGVTSPAMRHALDERRATMESRAAELLRQAVSDSAPWLETLGSMPHTTQEARRWTQAAQAIAAYRDRNQIDTNAALGRPTTLLQRRDMLRIQRMVDQASVMGFNSRSTGQGSALARTL